MSPGRTAHELTASGSPEHPGPCLFEAKQAEQDGRRSDAIAAYQAIANGGDPRGDTALGDLLLEGPDGDVAEAVAAHVLWSGELADRQSERAEQYWRDAIAIGDEPEAMLGLAEAAATDERFIEAVGWAIRGRIHVSATAVRTLK